MTETEPKSIDKKPKVPERVVLTLGEASDISGMDRIRAIIREEEAQESQEKSTVK